MPKPIGKRYINGDTLLEKIGFKPDSVLAKWLRRQPRMPELVNSQAAAEILGRLPNHMSRLKDRLPTPVPVEGTNRPLYIKSEIEDLRDELAREAKEKEA